VSSAVKFESERVNKILVLDQKMNIINTRKRETGWKFKESA
jgi:hypothetical protein